MKKVSSLVVLSSVLLLMLSSCASTQETVVISEEEKKVFEVSEGAGVELNDEESEYELLIIDPGFNAWLRSIARPKGFYSLAFLENRNNFYVQEWNRRVLGPGEGDIRFYELQINYDPQEEYGYDLNYELYNYFIYFQRRYGQLLGPFVPRI